ncbi:MAG: DUF3795 domain-containing protein [Dehalococcoidia bacterium]|nr:DUF3795 domain-containing protein [Dehalococcoidia bacterium]
MDDASRLTAYCGLYCKDCIPSKEELYSTAARLQTILEQLHFDRYAQLKAGQTYWSASNETYKHYPEFAAVLQAICRLECKSLCRDGGGWKGDRCQVRNCAIEKKMTGCWECAEYKTCEKLAPLLKFHPNLAYHLGLIKSEGINNWRSKRKGHYPWS